MADPLCTAVRAGKQRREKFRSERPSRMPEQREVDPLRQGARVVRAAWVAVVELDLHPENTARERWGAANKKRLARAPVVGMEGDIRG